MLETAAAACPLALVLALVLGSVLSWPPAGFSSALPETGAQEGAPALARDEVQVRAVFDGYKGALLDGDGAAAAALVDRATFAYWEELRDLALAGTEQQVRERSFIERLLVVSIRHQLSAEQLRAMTLEGLIGLAVDAGWISGVSIEQLEMGEVVVDGDRAQGQALTRAGTADPQAAGVSVSDALRYEFVREEGEWKFAFASLVRSLDRVIAELTSQLGAHQDDLIFALVEAFSGRQVLPEVWQPPEP